jgi:membrane protein implicated in regulation of membrane protease activity
LASLGVGLPAQAITFAVTAWLLPVLLRRQLVRRLAGRGVPSRTDALVGLRGEVTNAIDPILATGRVIVNGQDWAARGSGPLPAGTQVEVVGADGIVLIVNTLPDPSTL